MIFTYYLFSRKIVSFRRHHFPLLAHIVELQGLGLKLGVDFTFAWDNHNHNNHNHNHNNPHLNLLKGTVLRDKEQGVGIRDKG